MPRSEGTSQIWVFGESINLTFEVTSSIIANISAT